MNNEEDVSHLNNLSSSLTPVITTITTTKGRNTNLSLNEKFEVIKRIDSNISYSKISKEFNIAKGTVNKIKRNRDNIVESIENNAINGETIKRPRFSKEGKLIDVQLINWISEVYERGGSVSGKCIQEKALEIAFDHNIHSFKASNGWLQCFQRRHVNLFHHQNITDMNSSVLHNGSHLLNHTSSQMHIMSSHTDSYSSSNSTSLLTRQINAWNQFRDLIINDPLMAPLAPHVAAIDEQLSGVDRYS